MLLSHLTISLGIPGPSGRPDGARAFPADLALQRHGLRWNKNHVFSFEVLVSTSRQQPAWQNSAHTASIPAACLHHPTEGQREGTCLHCLLLKLRCVVQNNKASEGSRGGRNDCLTLWLGLLRSRDETWCLNPILLYTAPLYFCLA